MNVQTTFPTFKNTLSGQIKPYKCNGGDDRVETTPTAGLRTNRLVIRCKPLVRACSYDEVGEITQTYI